MEVLRPSPRSFPAVPPAAESLLVFALGLTVVQLGGRGVHAALSWRLTASSGVAWAVSESDVLGLAILGRESALALLLCLLVSMRRVSWGATLPVGRPSALAWGGSVLLVLGLAPSVSYVHDVTHGALPTPIPVPDLLSLAVRGASPLELLFLLFSAAIVPAIVEEGFFRGLLSREGFLPPTSRLLMPSLLFGLLHLVPAHAAGMSVLGLGLGTIRACTGSVFPAIAAHAAYNAAVLAVVFWGGASSASGGLGVPLLGFATAGLGLWLLASFGRFPGSGSGRGGKPLPDQGLTTPDPPS